MPRYKLTKVKFIGGCLRGPGQRYETVELDKPPVDKRTGGLKKGFEPMDEKAAATAATVENREFNNARAAVQSETKIGNAIQELTFMDSGSTSFPETKNDVNAPGGVVTL